MTKEELFNDPNMVVTYIGHIPAEYISWCKAMEEIMAGVNFLKSGHPDVKIVRIKDREDLVVGYHRPDQRHRRCAALDSAYVYGSDVYLMYKKRNTVDGRDKRLERWFEIMFNDSIDNFDYDGYLS